MTVGPSLKPPAAIAVFAESHRLGRVTEVL